MPDELIIAIILLSTEDSEGRAVYGWKDQPFQPVEKQFQRTPPMDSMDDFFDIVNIPIFDKIITAGSADNQHYRLIHVF